MSAVKRGCPEGAKILERGPAYYDAISKKEWRNEAQRAWKTEPIRRQTFYPALSMAEGGIFDVGCGSGLMAEMCMDLGLDYRRGLDFAPEFIHVARARCPGFEFHIGDIRKTKLFDRTDYWTVMFIETLEHIYEDLEVVSLVPKGHPVVLSVPSYSTEGHCRWFGGPSFARARYSRVLDVEALVIEKAISGNNLYFTIKGRRK